MKGDCGFQREVSPSDRHLPLGSIAVGQDEILPFSTLDCDGIRTLIESQVRFTTSHARCMLLGCALGRVAAYELYHILAQTGAHGKHGVTKESLAAAELIGPVLELEQAAIDRLRKSGPSPHISAE